ncbi:MAG: Uncharacterised protein [Methanobacteriota archaeon]|nr:MAG: Uncharacterised protein [Euryarchaeota archaeon]
MENWMDDWSTKMTAKEKQEGRLFDRLLKWW